MLTHAKRKLLLELSAPLLMDALHSLGLPERILDSAIRPIVPFSRMAGTAVTALIRSQPDPAKASLSAYAELLKSGAGVCAPVMAVQVPREHHNRGIFGEGSVTMGRHCGLAGALIEGAARDTHALRQMEFPVFSRAVAAAYICHKVEVQNTGSPVSIGGLTIDQGQIIFGDNDGVLVIHPAELDAVLKRALEIKAWEQETLSSLAQGLSLDETIKRSGPMPG